MNAPTNSPAKYSGTSLHSVRALEREPERHRRVQVRAAVLADREDGDHRPPMPQPNVMTIQPAFWAFE